MKKLGKTKRGFGSPNYNKKRQREIARMGGLAVSKNRQHMSEIGKKGGRSVSKNKKHMAEIGRKGGLR